jgi:anti-sigma-K factor RskA
LMDKDMEELLPLYALGALSDEERARVERYLQTDPEAMARVREYQATAQALSYVAQPVAPVAASKRALLQRLRPEFGAGRPSSEGVAGRRRRTSPGFLGRLAPALSLVVATVSLGAALATRAELGRVQAQNSELLSQLADHQEALRLVGSPELLALEVEGTDAAPQARGTFIAESDTRSGMLLLAGLPPLEPGMTYQAWLIRDGTPYPAGLFLVTAEGAGTLSLEAPDILGLYDALAVSLEPELGSLLPTGAIVLLGAISG